MIGEEIIDKLVKVGKVTIVWYDETEITLYMSHNAFSVIVDNETRLQTSSGQLFMQFVNTLLIGNLQQHVSRFAGAVNTPYLTRDSKKELMLHLEEIAKNQAKESPCDESRVSDTKRRYIENDSTAKRE